jgi:hypothetical protein
MRGVSFLSLLSLCAAPAFCGAPGAGDVSRDLRRLERDLSELSRTDGADGADVTVPTSAAASDLSGASFLAVAGVSSGRPGGRCSRLSSGVCMLPRLCPAESKSGQGCSGSSLCCDYEVDCGAIDLDAAFEHNKGVYESQRIFDQIHRVMDIPGERGAGFTRESGKFLCELQKEATIKPDGRVNHQTLEAVEAQMHARSSSWRRGPIYRDVNYHISVSAEPLWPKGTVEEQRTRLKEMILAVGGRVNPGGKKTVVGLRGLRMSPARENTVSLLKAGKTQYRDSFFVLPAEQNGRPTPFPGATYSGQTRGGRGLGRFDVNGDGANDIGVLKPGDYDTPARSYNFKGRPVYWVRPKDRSDDHVPVWRDTSQDGLYDLPEKLLSDRVTSGEQVSEDIGAYATAILFHPGAVSHPRSVGCQTMAPAVFQKFMHALGESSAARCSSGSNPPGVLSGISVATVDFNYVLIDARQLLIETSFAEAAGRISHSPDSAYEGLEQCKNHPSLYCVPGQWSCPNGHISGQCSGDTWCCRDASSAPQLAACDDHPSLVCKPGRSSCGSAGYFSGQCRGDTWCCKE